MSFQSNGFWMSKSPSYLTEGEMAYDNSSRIEPKRAHQWFVDASEPELFPNKKQAVEASNSRSISGIASVNVSPWENASSFQSVSGQFSDRLFGSETVSTINFDGRNIPSVDAGNLNMGRKSIEEPFGNDPCVGLSISHTMEDPRACLSYGGIRKVKINQVKDSDNCLTAMGRTYNMGENTIISMGHIYNGGDDNPITMGHNYNREVDNSMSMGHNYDKEDNINIISMGHTYDKGADNIISMGHTYNKGQDNTIPIGHTYNKVGDNTISMGHFYNKGDSNIMLMGHTYKGESNTISFGGFHEEPETNPSGRLISGYDLLTSQSSVQQSEAVSGKELVDSNADVLVRTAHMVSFGTETIPKNKMELKMSKKVTPNNFPSNVKSLLSTGMLDGVPVKYISWSREKELRGIIKGSGYLCSCQCCNFSKALNAYEFERHAGCKTKHPNNHIFFENGKTIYGIVQELRSTPQNLLFEAIQTVTGSAINQKAFGLWKESFEAATRELQRIYGNELQQSQKELS